VLFRGGRFEVFELGVCPDATDLGEGDWLAFVPTDAPGVRLHGSGVELVTAEPAGLSDTECSIFKVASIPNNKIANYTLCLC